MNLLLGMIYNIYVYQASTKKIFRGKINIKTKKKKIAFLIGNTAKLEKGNYYFTPPRITEKLVIFGVIVFNESIVIEACKYLDKKVDYIFVDVEKKIFPKKMVHLET